MPQTMTGKQALLEMLKAEGVEHIFGNPGTSEAPIMDMLGDYPELKYFLTLQESVAMGMGEAYARATEKPSLVMLHVDSGLANGIALMLDALNTLGPGNSFRHLLRDRLGDKSGRTHRIRLEPCPKRQRPRGRSRRD